MDKYNFRSQIELISDTYGNERKIELIDEVLKNGSFIPNTVKYEDIDESVKKWVNELSINTNDNVSFPTMTLFSNQRFSEYNQSWKFLDSNKNILLNFKTVTRENNPQLGKIHSGYWNIPGDDRFYLMKRIIALDDNGSESFLDLLVKQPMAIDFNYKVSVFASQYEYLNKYNLLINDKFKSRQCYVSPNGHYMPMNLEGISDESSYSIDDRQYYSQTYTIKLLGYVFTEEDYKIRQVPLKIGLNLPMMNKGRKTVEVEENCDDIKFILTFPNGDYSESIKFKSDINANVKSIETENVINGYVILVNGNEVSKRNFKIKKDDEIRVNIRKKNHNKASVIVLNCKP